MSLFLVQTLLRTSQYILTLLIVQYRVIRLTLRIIFQLVVYKLLMELQIGLVQQQTLQGLRELKVLKVTQVLKVRQVLKGQKVTQA